MKRRKHNPGEYSNSNVIWSNIIPEQHVIEEEVWRARMESGAKNRRKSFKLTHQSVTPLLLHVEHRQPTTDPDK